MTPVDLDKYPLLKSVDDPADLRALDEDQLKPLCDELREFLIETVARIGGHLGAGLGTVGTDDCPALCVRYTE